MKLPVISSPVEVERDVVVARQFASQLAELLGYDVQDRTRIATAVSEIARNAYNYAGRGRVDFAVDLPDSADPSLRITISDSGPGIADVDRILRGRYASTTGMGLGIIGARRLMDGFGIESGKSGTVVNLSKRLPARSLPIDRERIATIAVQLQRSNPRDAFEELHRQNLELIETLEELSRRQEELARLNQELEDTNRGVVALYAELDERAERLRQSDEVKSRFLSHMSHEFRTPLSSMLALSRLLLDRADGELSDEQERQVKFIRKSAEDLSELVNDLLDLAKVEAGKIDIVIEQFSVEALFGGLRGVMRPLLTTDNVTLSLEVISGPFDMVSDESKLSQILRNLISNALKFTESGEVRVTAMLVDDGQDVRMSVMDTGIGIEPENLDVIFQEFGQVRSQSQRKVKGTGLGLPLSRRLAELLGGKLTVQSQPGVGSTFTVTVPRTLGEPGQRMAGMSMAARPSMPSAVPAARRCLVVDDEAPSRYLLRRLLEAEGCSVIEAGCGEDAITLVHAQPPDIVFLDMMMPDILGSTVASRLRSEERTRQLPVYIVTSKILTSAEREQLERIAVPVLSKESLSQEIVRVALATADATRRTAAAH